MSSPKDILKKVSGKATSPNLKLLYTQLVNMRSSTRLIKKDPQSCKEIISTIIEFLIKSEQANEPDLFDTFCELNFLNEFLQLTSLDDYEINLSIIESFSVLLVNLTSITSLYYIFSNNFINQIISKDYTHYDENFLSFYINFLKSLSLRIDTKTIQFFYRTNENSFPLLQSALKLYNFHDSMIRTCVRTIIMTVLKIDYDRIQEHFTKLPTVEYFVFVVLHLRDLVLQLDNELSNTENIRQEQLCNLTGDILDEILYISDIFALHLKKINYVLMNSLFMNLILPLLCESLVTQLKPKISISLSIFILILLMDNIKDESFSNVLFTVLLSDKRSHDVVEYFKQPKDNRNYSSQWSVSNSQKTPSVPLIEFIGNNYSEGFLMALLSDKHSVYSAYPSTPELKEISKRVKAKTKTSEDPIEFSEMKKIINDSFSSADIQLMRDYHKSISNSIGLAVGLISFSGDKFQSGFMCEVLKYYQIVKLKYVDKSHLLFPNDIKSNLYSYLESKDDTLLLLVNMLLFFSMEKPIAPFLISESKLTNFNRQPKGESNCNANSDLIYLNSIFANSSNDEAFSLSFGCCSNSINDTSVSFKSFIFDNAFFSQMSNDTIEPDLVLISNLVKLLLINPPLRKMTSELILLNLNHLLICNSTRSLQVNIGTEVKGLFKEIIAKTVFYINDIIDNSLKIKEKSFEIFKEEWISYTTSTTPLSSLLTLIERPFCLIPSNIHETIEGYPIELKPMTNDIDQLKYHLLIFMKVHDLALIIFNQHKAKSFIKKRFPLQADEFEFEVGQSYSLSSISEENSYVLQSQLKTPTMTEYIEVIAIVYFSFLYFAVYEDDSKAFALIKFKNYLGNICLIRHLNENSVILVQMLNKDEPQFSIRLCNGLEEQRNKIVSDINAWTRRVINTDRDKFCAYFQRSLVEDICGI